MVNGCIGGYVMVTDKDNSGKTPRNDRWRFTGLESYVDEDALVVRDTNNSRAWFRSDVVMEVRE